MPTFSHSPSVLAPLPLATAGGIEDAYTRVLRNPVPRTSTLASVWAELTAREEDADLARRMGLDASPLMIEALAAAEEEGKGTRRASGGGGGGAVMAAAEEESEWECECPLGVVACEARQRRGGGARAAADSLLVPDDA